MTTLPPRGWDGSVDRAAHWRSQAVVTDDFGDHYQIRRCSRCRRWLPACEENFTIRSRFENGMVKTWDSKCRPCRRIVQRDYYASSDEQKVKARRRAYYQRMRRDDEALEKRRASNREYRRRVAQANPEVIRRHSQAYYERIRNDPERWARKLEDQRFFYRLRRERLGVPIERKSPSQSVSGRGHGPVIDGRPLYRFVTDYVDSRPEWMSDKDVCKELGISDRTMREWRNGQRQKIRAEIADRLLQGLDLQWWEVWAKPANGHERGRPEDVLRYIAEAEVYMRASLAFTGELVE